MLATTRVELLESLKRQLRQISASELADQAVEAVSTGIPALDDVLPQHGIPPGGMVEWLTDGPGVGATTMALAGVRAALPRGGRWVVIDLRGDFFPLAVAGWGIPLERLVLVRPTTARDAAWAFEQSLRCPGVCVSWHWLEATPERTLQRWKAAAEVGQGQGVLFRPLTAQRQASWADVRWLVQAMGSSGEATVRRLRLDLAYCRGLLGGQRIDLECDDEAGSVRLAAPLVHSTAPQRKARA